MRSALVLAISISSVPLLGCGPEIFLAFGPGPAPALRPSLESNLDRIGRNRAIDTRLPPSRDRRIPVPAAQRDPWRLSAPAGSDAAVLGLGTALVMTAAVLQQGSCPVAPCSGGSWQEAGALGLMIGGAAVLTAGLSEAGVVDAHDVPRLFPWIHARAFGIHPSDPPRPGSWSPPQQ